MTTIPMSEVKNEIPVIMVIATHKLAPEVIPNTEGPANGLLNNVCIRRPAIESPIPAKTAINVRGIRSSR
jgi:hypothetical protein